MPFGDKQGLVKIARSTRSDRHGNSRASDNARLAAQIHDKSSRVRRLAVGYRPSFLERLVSSASTL